MPKPGGQNYLVLILVRRMEQLGGIVKVHISELNSDTTITNIFLFKKLMQLHSLHVGGLLAYNYSMCEFYVPSLGIFERNSMTIKMLLKYMMRSSISLVEIYEKYALVFLRYMKSMHLCNKLHFLHLGFVKVNQLKPGTEDINLIVKVLNTNVVVNKNQNTRQQFEPRITRVAESLVGDETGNIIFTARNEQGNANLVLSLFSFCCLHKFIFCVLTALWSHI